MRSGCDRLELDDVQLRVQTHHVQALQCEQSMQQRPVMLGRLLHDCVYREHDTKRARDRMSPHSKRARTILLYEQMRAALPGR